MEKKKSTASFKSSLDHQSLGVFGDLYLSSQYSSLSIPSPLTANEKLSRCRVLVIDGDLFSSQDLHKDLSVLKKSFPELVIILVADSFNSEFIKKLINDALCFQIFKKKDKSLIEESIQRGFEQSEKLQSQRKILREISQKNRELELFTRDLEKIVAERTYHIEISKQEIENKIVKMRQVLRFIKTAGSRSNLDELVQLIRQEVRRFHKVGDPLVLYKSESRGQFLLFFHQGHIIERKLTQDVPEEARYFLAEQLDRPVAQLVSIPLVHGKATLFVEHSLSKDEVEDFKHFVEERLQAMGMAFERLLIDEQVTTASFRWEKTFDGVRDPICIVDADLQILHANGAFHQSFGGLETLSEGLFGEKTLALAFETGEPQNGSLSHEGSLYEIHSYPIGINKDGRVSNVVNYYTDVTSKRRLYSRMIQNEKMGAIGLLAGSIAHELNNPLTGIRSLAQIIKGEADDEQLRSDLAEVEKAAFRSQKVIKNLLDFSKGHGDLDVVSIDQIVEKTLPMLKTALRLHRLKLDLQSSEWRVKVEPNLLQQVVFNLVNNACQAMEKPGEVVISTFKKEKKLCLSVSDTGPGIMPENIKRVFEPFFTTKQEGAGTGLGLSMSKSIISNFNGRLDVESQLGVGSTFTVELPIAGGRD